MLRLIIRVASVLLFLCALLFASYAFISMREPSNVSDSLFDTPALVLMRNNIDFAMAEQLASERKYHAAIISLQKAILHAHDNSEVAQIKYSIAQDTEMLGAYSEAIVLLKNITADQTNDSIIRASAVQELGRIYYTTYDSALSILIFSSAPYSQWYDKNNISLSYRKLFDYAASIYPLNYSEVYRAEWYAKDLVQNYATATTSPQAHAEFAIIQEALQKERDDNNRIAHGRFNITSIPASLGHEAYVYQLLAPLGFIPQTAVDQTYQKAVEGENVFDTFGVVRYKYAAYLAKQYGVMRLDDIRNLLVVYTADASVKLYPSVRVFFRQARTSDQLTDERSTIKQLASLSPSFKTYLISVGWSNSDFTKD